MMPTDTPHTHDPHTTLVGHLQQVLSCEGTGQAQVHVQVVQTHISTVLLAGDVAYKLKRPVRLPFLDFSTLAQRHHFLQEELRLNRRTAPELYQGLVPITGTVEAPQLGGDEPTAEPVIEWALRMWRLDADSDFRALAETGQLNTQHIDALADHLAGFHLLLPPTTPAPGANVLGWAATSLDEVAAATQRPASCPLTEVHALREALLGQLAQARPTPAQRQAAGWVRECHGDLHLGNLATWKGTVLAFDALEFDPALRHIDVVSDLAFAFMDLLAHGLPHWAWRLVNRHVEHTGDFAGLPLLPALAAYRALVRAKVALLAPNGAGEFTRYWPLAQWLLHTPRPRLVLTTGLSGSGKSTLALMLAEQLGAVRVRSDVERKRLFGLAPTARPAANAAPQLGLYTQDATERTYARLGELAHDLLAGGLSVVVDAACLRQHERAALRTLAQSSGAGFVLVNCEASTELLQSRIAQRQAAGNDASDATLAVLALQQRVIEPLPDDWASLCHRITNEGTLDALAAQAQALAQHIGGSSPGAWG